MSEANYIEVELRLPADVAAAARRLTGDGVVCATRISVLLYEAEGFAGRDEARCYGALLEACIINDAVQDFLCARDEMHREAWAADSGSKMT